MTKPIVIKIDKTKMRNEIALDAKMRRAGPMKHVNTNRGSSSTWRDLLDDE